MFGVEFLCCLNLMYVFIVLVQFGFPQFCFCNGDLFVIARFRDHCLLVPFHYISIVDIIMFPCLTYMQFVAHLLSMY